MYAAGYISRDDEAKIPNFNSHDEARKWFKSKYADSFMLIGSEQIGDRKCYFYYLILDKDAFNAGRESFAERTSLNDLFLNNNFISNARHYLFSYQSIEIFEDGSVHIIH